MPILEWFKMKFKELKEKLGVGHTPKKKNRPQRELEYNSLIENKNVILIVNELHFEYFCKYFVSLINKPR